MVRIIDIRGLRTKEFSSLHDELYQSYIHLHTESGDKKYQQGGPDDLLSSAIGLHLPNTSGRLGAEVHRELTWDFQATINPLCDTCFCQSRRR